MLALSQVNMKQKRPFNTLLCQVKHSPVKFEHFSPCYWQPNEMYVWVGSSEAFKRKPCNRGDCHL